MKDSTCEKIVDIFKDVGMLIESGATYSVKGQIAQLLNGAEKTGLLCEWISVDDAYPEKDGLYLCHFSDGAIETFDYQEADADLRTWGVHNDIVTHWMPLPIAPAL
jgi:hypothetical protein